jgi:hypothetical protein
MVGRSTSNSSLFLVLSALLGVSLGIPNAGCGDSGESRTPVAVRVTEYVNLADLEGPMPDAEVCETDTENCVITDEEGRASIELPSDTEVSYTITKEGFGSYLVSDVNSGRLDHRFIMYSDEELARLAPLMGTTYPCTPRSPGFGSYPNDSTHLYTPLLTLRLRACCFRFGFLFRS